MLSVLPTPLDGLDESWMAFFPPGVVTWESFPFFVRGNLKLSLSGFFPSNSPIHGMARLKVLKKRSFLVKIMVGNISQQ